MLELDLLLQGFLERGYAGLDAEGRAGFERLLALPDPQLHDYLLGLERPAEAVLSDVIERIRQAVEP